MTNFYLLNTLGNANDDSLVLIEDYVEGLSMEGGRVNEGQSVAATWPSDATIRLRKTSGRKLTDVLGTTWNKLFVSRRFREIEDPPPLFRIKDSGHNQVVTSELAKALYAAKMTNLYWDKLEVR